jgi:hypothetical protein
LFSACCWWLSFLLSLVLVVWSCLVSFVAFIVPLCLLLVPVMLVLVVVRFVCWLLAIFVGLLVCLLVMRLLLDLCFLADCWLVVC